VAHVNIFSLPKLVMEKLHNFQRNTHSHNLQTICKYHLHIANVNLTKHQGGVLYHICINLFSKLLPTIKRLHHDTNILKPTLRDYLLTQSISYVDGSKLN
jgi:hypothetical protein